MGRDLDFSKVTWREFYDSKRNRPYVTNAEDRMVDAKHDGWFDYEGADEPGQDRYRFKRDVYLAPGTHGARTLAFMYGDYRDKVRQDGGTPTEFERPTTDGWES